MIPSISLKEKYFQLKPYLDLVREKVDQTIINYCQKNLFAYLSRIKELESLCEKIEGGRYSSLEEVDDLIACVIIIPNLNDEEMVINFLMEVFEQFDIRKRGSTKKGFDVFRFDSTRFIGKLIHTQNENLRDVKFEVQIRSAFEHAWSVTTHDLAYKAGEIDWKTLRLASQLKSSVEQLDMIVLSASDLSKTIPEHEYPEIIIKKVLLEAVELKFVDKTIPEEVRPKDISRVIDNIYRLIKNLRSLRNMEKYKENILVISEKIKEGIDLMSIPAYPISLSLFQSLVGVLLSQEIIDAKTVQKIFFHKTESFLTIFPKLKTVEFNEFKL